MNLLGMYADKKIFWYDSKCKIKVINQKASNLNFYKIFLLIIHNKDLIIRINSSGCLELPSAGASILIPMPTNHPYGNIPAQYWKQKDL